MTLPFLISLPHCSGKIPESVRSAIVLTETEIIDTIDLGTLEIFSDLPAKMILCAQWNRLVVDLNRPPDRRDTRGPVALVDYQGRFIYGPEAIPDEREIVQRLSTYYYPYHQRLENALHQANIKGLLDCHSLKGIGPPESPDSGKKRKDITLGNNGGPSGEKDPSRGETTCDPALLRFIKEVFERAGFSVSLNIPYAGGAIISHYGPALMTEDKIALQIEINQNLYLEPDSEKIIPEKASDIRSRMLECLKEIGEAI